MAFPTIPTVAAGRILGVNQANANETRTFPSLTELTKNSGDLLIAIAIAYQTTATANAAFSGWTGGFTEFKDQSSSTTMAIGMAYKWSTGEETGTFAVTQAPNINGHAALIVMAIPGAHASTIPEATAKANATTEAANPAELNPAGWGTEDTLWIAVCGVGETGTGGAWEGIKAAAPSEYTDRFETGLSGDAIGAVEGGVAFHQDAAAAEDAGTWSVDTSNARNSAMVIAVRPKGGQVVPLEPAAASSTAKTGLPIHTTPRPTLATATCQSSTKNLRVHSPKPVPLNPAAAQSVGGTLDKLRAPVKMRLSIAAGVSAHTTNAAKKYTTSGSRIILEIGNCNVPLAGGAATMVALVKLANTETYANQWLIHRHTSTVSPTAVGMGFGYEGTNGLRFYPGPGPSPAFIVPDEEWVLLVGTKTTGTTKPKFYVYRFSTQEWESREGATAFSAEAPGPNASPFSTILGRWSNSEQFRGVYAAAAVWGAALSQAEVESLVTVNHLDEWTEINSPRAVWLLDQPDGKVRDITGSSADQLSSAGIEVVADPPPIPYWPADTPLTINVPEPGPIEVPLDPAAGQSNAALALHAPIYVPLNAAAGQSNAALALHAPIYVPLNAAAGQSSAALALHAPKYVLLDAAAGQSSAALALTAPTRVPLDAAAGQSTASAPLTINVPEPGAVEVPLNPAAGQSTASAPLPITTPARPSLGAAAGQSNAALALRAPTAVPLVAASSQSTTSLAFRTPMKVLLSAATALSTAAMQFSVKTPIALAAAVGQSVTKHLTIIIGKATIPINPATGISTTSLAFRVPAGVPLNPAASASSTALALHAPSLAALGAAVGLSTTSLAFHTPSRVALAPAVAQATAALLFKVQPYIPLDPAVGLSTASMFFVAGIPVEVVHPTFATITPTGRVATIKHSEGRIATFTNDGRTARMS